MSRQQHAKWPGFAIAFTAAFDNFAMTPLLRAIAKDMTVELSATTAVATAYFLAYGVLQVPWGLASERLGRITVIRLGLLVGALGAAVTVSADSLQALLIGRFIAGAGMASAVPSVMAWMGDVLPLEERSRAATDLNAAYAVGAAGGVLGAGLLADTLGWRFGFGVSGALALLSLVASSFLSVPPRPATPGRLRDALKVPQVRTIAAIALVEGATLFGLFAFLAPTLLAGGASARLTGMLIGSYGVAVVVWARVQAAMSRKISVLQSMAFGGAALVIGWSVAAASPTPPGILVAALLIAATIVFFHSQLQVWATQAAPHARGPAIAMFSGSLFVGASSGTALARPAFATGEVRAVYLVGALVALGVTAVTLVMRRRSLVS